MVSLVLGMLVCVALALVVMALVAVPARRAGREVLTERGEEVLDSIRVKPPVVFARNSTAARDKQKNELRSRRLQQLRNQRLQMFLDDLRKSATIKDMRKEISAQVRRQSTS